MNLSVIQQEIIEVPGNMVVRASAGTGKTHTMVAKITKEMKSNHTHKVIAAITFTVKAAKEIRNRLKIDTTGHFIGTNNSFAIEEIIKPFARDVYGNGFRMEMCTDYSKEKQKQTFQECLDFLRETQTICSYVDNKKNFVYELALEIVQKSKACRLFLQAKYFKIYIDEYQDCDMAMHRFFMYLCNVLKIEFFIVGDDKQSIYIWRGAYPEAFRSVIEMDNFHKKVLWENHRSCQMIQNYSNLLFEETKSLYKFEEISNTSPVVLVNTTCNNWVHNVLPHLDFNKEIALLRYARTDAKSGAMQLSKTGTEFTFIPIPPISEITTNVSWLYNAIAHYFILPIYSIYDFIDEIPEESIDDKNIRGFLERNLKKISVALNDNNTNEIIEKVNEIATYFGYTTNKDHIEKMINTIIDKQYHPAFHMNELNHIAITFHSSKGLEFEQVIVFANDYDLSKQDSIDNHYVAVTRAKSKLVIVRLKDVKASAGDKYWQNINNLFSQSGITPWEVMTIVDL